MKLNIRSIFFRLPIFTVNSDLSYAQVRILSLGVLSYYMFAIKYVWIIVAKYRFTNTFHILISSLIWWCQTWRRVCHIHSRPTRWVKTTQNAIYWPSLHSHKKMLDIFLSKDVDEPIFEPSIHLQLEVGDVIMFPWFVFQVPLCQNDFL